LGASYLPTPQLICVDSSLSTQKLRNSAIGLKRMKRKNVKSERMPLATPNTSKINILSGGFVMFLLIQRSYGIDFLA